MQQEKMQYVVSMKCSGAAHYKAINLAGMGKAPHSSLAESNKEQRQWKKLQNPGKCSWK